MTLYEDEFSCRMVNLPGPVSAATRLSGEDSYPNIYINDQLSPMGKLRAFRHEIHHLENDDFMNDKTITEVEGLA